MTRLDIWIKQATRGLSTQAIAQVEVEIQQHHELAREGALQNGASADGADRLAVEALGDAKLANRQYRKVLLTASEARQLHDGSREVFDPASHRWVSGLIIALSGVVLIVAIAKSVITWHTLLLAAVPTALLLATPFLPIYTPSRARIFRCAKWAVILGILALADLSRFPWVLFIFWHPVWAEWKRACIRRKLPVERWPRQLYL